MSIFSATRLKCRRKVFQSFYFSELKNLRLTWERETRWSACPVFLQVYSYIVQKNKHNISVKWKFHTLANKRETHWKWEMAKFYVGHNNSQVRFKIIKSYLNASISLIVYVSVRIWKDRAYVTSLNWIHGKDNIQNLYIILIAKSFSVLIIWNKATQVYAILISYKNFQMFLFHNWIYFTNISPQNHNKKK